MIVLMGLLVGAVVVIRGRKEDPLKLVSEAETALTEIEGQLAQYRKILVTSGGESEEAELMLEAGNAAYKDAGRLFGGAIGATDDDQLKIDIFFKLVDYHAENNAFHEGEWPKVYGCWNAILNIDPKNIKAMKAQLENLYQIADYGNDNSWTVIEANASDLLDIMKEKLGEAYEMFLSLLVNNEIVEAYKMFLNQLPAIYMSNQHTRPQSLIILDNNIENIDQLINLENHDEMASFYKLMNTEMIIYNMRLLSRTPK